MLVFAQGFSAPKAGNSPQENDDGCYPVGSLEIDRRVFRCAVADGATESSYSGPLARMMVGQFRRGRLAPRFWDYTLSLIRQQWESQVSSKALAWYATEKADHGAFAAFLGLTIWDGVRVPNGGKWRSIAVGDCCVAHIRRDSLLAQFPVDKSNDFDSRPYLISSKEEANRDLDQHLRIIKGEWQSDDCFLLMTDALACWFATRVELGDHPWNVLRDFGAQESRETFSSFVASRRTSGEMKNDDVTLVRVDVVARPT